MHLESSSEISFDLRRGESFTFERSEKMRKDAERCGKFRPRVRFHEGRKKYLTSDVTSQVRHDLDAPNDLISSENCGGSESLGWFRIGSDYLIVQSRAEATR